MYIVTLQNNVGDEIEIHGRYEKLKSGKITKGINAIDSFQFSILPSNIGFNLLQDYVTLVKVYNTNKERYEFYGRVLYSSPSMSESGLLAKDVVCESYLGFLCDSQMHYVAPLNWSVDGLLKYIISRHNSQVEDYKQFTVGDVTVTGDEMYVALSRKSSWELINEMLIDVYGGEIRLRVEGDTVYIDYLEKNGIESTTEIAVSKNMKSISQEKDPTEIVTRLIPLGRKLKTTSVDEDGNQQEVETEYRIMIDDVNDGKEYIDDSTAIARYGVREGTVTFDDIEDKNELLERGELYLSGYKAPARISYRVC